MNKLIGLILASTIFIAAGAMVLSIGVGIMGELGDFTDSVTDTDSETGVSESSGDTSSSDEADGDGQQVSEASQDFDAVDNSVLYLEEDFSGEDIAVDGIGEWFHSVRIQDEHRYDGALSFSDQYVRRGDQSMRLHAKNPDEWDYSEVNSYRVEVGTHANRWEMWNYDYSGWNIVGEPLWFSFSVYVPEDYQIYDEDTTTTENIAEFHANLPSEYYDNDYSASERKPWVMNIWDDEFAFTNGFLNEDGESDYEHVRTDMEPGNWYDVVVHTEWADGEDEYEGFQKIWVNGEQVYDHEGPTVLDSEEPPRPLKLSIYNSQWTGSDSYVDERTLYFDDVRFGWYNATYEDMMSGKIE